MAWFENLFKNATSFKEAQTPSRMKQSATASSGYSMGDWEKLVGNKSNSQKSQQELILEGKADGILVPPGQESSIRTSQSGSTYQVGSNGTTKSQSSASGSSKSVSSGSSGSGGVTPAPKPTYEQEKADAKALADAWYKAQLGGYESRLDVLEEQTEEGMRQIEMSSALQGLGLEEAQRKYGVSGGIGLGQLAQLDAQIAGLYGQLEQASQEQSMEIQSNIAGLDAQRTLMQYQYEQDMIDKGYTRKQIQAQIDATKTSQAIQWQQLAMAEEQWDWQKEQQEQANANTLNLADLLTNLGLK